MHLPIAPPHDANHAPENANFLGADLENFDNKDGGGGNTKGKSFLCFLCFRSYSRQFKLGAFAFRLVSKSLKMRLYSSAQLAAFVNP